jgi:hypothetical protein
VPLRKGKRGELTARSFAVAATTALAMLLSASSIAQADTANILEPQHHPANATDGWQAGPCTTDTPPCSPQTPAQFFKTAGGHPPRGFVQFLIRHQVLTPKEIEPLVEPLRSRVPKTVRVDLPPGLSVNPRATRERCTLEQLLHKEKGAYVPQCPAGSKIGESKVKLVTGVAGFLGLPKGNRFFPEGPEYVPTFTQVDLFNIVPAPGEPALFGFVVAAAVPVLLKPEVAWESDFHESFTIEGLPDFNTIELGGLLAPVVIHTARLITFGDAGDGTFATNPTTCFNADEPQFHHLYSSWIREDSFEEPNPTFPAVSTPIESALPAGIHPEGCEAVPFDPSIEVVPGTLKVDSPAAATITTRLKVENPATGGGPIAESQLRTAEVTLPQGMGLNPSGSVGLLACPDAAFHKGQRVAANECPADSVLGTAEIRTPVLSQALSGNVYAGEPKSNDPASGEEFRLFVEAKSDAAGVVVRLIGNVRADRATGQLTARFDEQEVSPLFGELPHGLPQLPFESLSLSFTGARKVLSTPLTCGPNTATSAMEPWARPGTHVSPVAGFVLPNLPDGGACPRKLGERPFGPLYGAAPDNRQAGAYSPLRVHIVRPDGHQELKMLDVTLPKGAVGKLAGIPFCPEAAVAAARGRSGIAEQRSPSCPAASLVGTTSTESGTGSTPLRLPGRVYLAGPYRGAPFSLVSISPALSGPYDLGTVVVRVALNFDPRTAQITAASDVIPDVFGGVRLDLRTIDFNLDRKRFTVNPTRCSGLATTGALRGGGADPANPAAFGSYSLNVPFQIGGCDALGFQPSLVTKLSGPTKRHGYPSLTATLRPREGDANVSSVSLTLPHSFFVAQEHIGSVCTRTQLAARSCPQSAAYGEAEATTPLLDGKLRGQVYLVPGGHKLPDLIVDLHGQVDVQLQGVISSRKGKVTAAFESAPDVPLGEFVLRMAGGRTGLIVNSANICKRRQPAALTIQGQNGKRLATKKYKLSLAGCRKRPKVRVKPGRSGVVPHAVR